MHKDKIIIDGHAVGHAEDIYIVAEISANHLGKIGVERFY